MDGTEKKSSVGKVQPYNFLYETEINQPHFIVYRNNNELCNACVEREKDKKIVVDIEMIIGR